MMGCVTMFNDTKSIITTIKKHKDIDIKHAMSADAGLLSEYQVLLLSLKDYISLDLKSQPTGTEKEDEQWSI
jgi:hypothetical protein